MCSVFLSGGRDGKGKIDDVTDIRETENTWRVHDLGINFF
jgi:hypothetical protein